MERFSYSEHKYSERKNVQDFTLDDDQKPKVELQGDGAGDNIFWETDFDNIEEMK